eukprot:5455712-Amphidinium_carterae.1
MSSVGSRRASSARSRRSLQQIQLDQRLAIGGHKMGKVRIRLPRRSRWVTLYNPRATQGDCLFMTLCRVLRTHIGEQTPSLLRKQIQEHAAKLIASKERIWKGRHLGKILHQHGLEEDYFISSLTGRNRRWGNTIDVAICAHLFQAPLRLIDIRSSRVLFENGASANKDFMEIGYIRKHFVAGRVRSGPTRPQRNCFRSFFSLLMGNGLMVLFSSLMCVHACYAGMDLALPLVTGGAPKMRVIAGTGQLHRAFDRPFQQIGYDDDLEEGCLHCIQNTHDLASMLARHRELPPEISYFRRWPRAFCQSLAAGDREMLQSAIHLIREARATADLFQQVRAFPTRTPVPDNFAEDIVVDVDQQDFEHESSPVNTYHVIANPAQLIAMEAQFTADNGIIDNAVDAMDDEAIWLWQLKGRPSPGELHRTWGGIPMPFDKCVDMIRSILESLTGAPRTATGDSTIQGQVVDDDECQECDQYILNPRQLRLMTSLYCYQAVTRVAIRRNQLAMEEVHRDDVQADVPSAPADDVNGDDWRLNAVRAILGASIGAPQMAAGIEPLPGELLGELGEVAILNPQQMELMTVSHCQR